MADKEKLKILELNLDANAMIEEIKALKQRIAELKEAQKEAKESGGELSDEYITISNELKGTQEQLRSTENVFKKLLIAQKDTIGTIQKLEAENAKLREEQKKLNLTTEEGRKRNEEINAKLNENNKIIFENSDKLKQNKMSVGGYVDAMKEMGLGLRDISQNFGIAGGAVDMMNVKMLRFLMSPIGLLIAAITGAIKLLADALKNFKPFMDWLEQSAAAVSAALSVLKDSVVALITGAKSLGQVFRGLGKDMKDAAEAAAQLKKEQQDIEDAWEVMAVKEKEAGNAIDELLLKSKNRTLSEKQRIELMQQALDLEKKMHEERLALAQADYDNTVKMIANKHKIDVETIKRGGAEYLKQMQDKKTINDEEVKNFIDKQMKLLDIENESIKIREKVQNKMDELADKAAEKERQRHEAEKKRREELMKMKQEEAAAEEKLTKQAVERKQKEIDELLKQMQLEIELYRRQHKTLISDRQAMTAEMLQAEKDRLDAIHAQELGALEMQRTMTNMKEEEYLIKKYDLIDSYNAQVAELENRYAMEQLQVEEENFQNRLAQYNDNEAKYFELIRQDLERRRQMELAAADKTGADKTLIEKKYAKFQRDIAVQEFNAKMELVSSFATNVARLFGKATIAGKMAASAQTVVETIKGAQSAFAAAQVIPPPGGQIIGAANAALVIAAGAKAVSEIWATKSGLPEDGGGAGKSSLSATAPTATAATQTAEAINQNIAGQTGAGLVARQTANNVGMSITEQLARINLQPVLVIDDVTAKQSQISKRSATQVL
jgi:hypothetical protein